jgi:biopolymer transport protein ExbD
MISANSSIMISSSPVSTGAQQSVSHIDLTPLIDVVFIVVVFLLLTANTRLLSLPIVVPESDDIPEAVSSLPAVINITVSADEKGWFIGDEHFESWAAFRQVLLRDIQRKPDSAVAIAADQQADVQRFVKVLTLLTQQKIKNTQIILKQEH